MSTILLGTSFKLICCCNQDEITLNVGKRFMLAVFGVTIRPEIKIR